VTNRHPIIYIRGYAMTAGERNETTADPFCGFNVGSTLYRATAHKGKAPEKMVFESPVVRLMSEFNYQHVYQNGFDIMDDAWEPARNDKGDPIPGIPPASIVILRYYDDGSEWFGDGESRKVTVYAERLNKLILRVKKLVLEYQKDGEPVMKDEDFRCYLVAHSMGGLVARAFLQGVGDYKEARASVDKFFTFSTPHNGIDVLGLNVPSWLTGDQKNTFNREYMAEYLNLKEISPAFGQRVDLIPVSALTPDRIFCMVGTNRGDYEVLQGAVRAFVGNGSDGLVRIDNASLWGIKTDSTGQLVKNSEVPVATAYAYRSHSGYLGIVNSEEAYQNLTRFLFGDVRVDIYLDIEKVSLPPAVEDEVNAGQKLEAGYQFEFSAAPKGKRWFLTRRQSVEDSSACRSHEELSGGDKRRRSIYLSSVFLSKWAKVDNDSSLSYAMTISAKTPDYAINRRFLPNAHYEGTDLFRGTAIARLTPPASDNASGGWCVNLSWLDAKGTVNKVLQFSKEQVSQDICLPFDQPKIPGIKGVLRLKVQPWK
jgi:pimeloyl-ACP methyl ester carboxylesterase